MKHQQKKDIYEYITEEEAAFALDIPIVDSWDWGMRDHIRKTVLYKHGQLVCGKTDDNATKNITLPILRLRYRTEGFDVKDIQLYVDDSESYWKSFLVKKFHERFAAQYKIDTFIDEGSETDIDFGGVLVKDSGDVCPEVVPWQSIAFCDQTDVLSGPICIRHQYPPDQIKEMEKKGWGDKKKGATGTVDEVIVLAKNYKKDQKPNQRETKTPGKYIEVFELHGMFPNWWLGDDYEASYDEFSWQNEYSRQLHIVTFYKDTLGQKQGICLYKGKENELPFKFRSDKIYNRALGYGGVEELIESQVWTNYGTARIKDMLDAASKIILQTTDPAFANRNKIQNMANLEITVVDDGKEIKQIDTSPKTMALFDNFIASMELHARQTGAATESLMGESPSAGTPFKLQELVTQTSLGLHEHRMGKYAVFVEEIYREWIIPKIVKEISKGTEFLADIDLEELQQVADSVVLCETNKILKERILNGETIYPDEVEVLKQTIRDEFMKGGSKRFIEIFKDEFKDAPLDIKINIKGKQTDLAKYVDKLVNIFRMVIANPQGFAQVMQLPGMGKTWNEIIEASGLSPIDFGGYTQKQLSQEQPQQSQQIPQPIKVENLVSQKSNA